jgi:hypothetical protein
LTTAPLPVGGCSAAKIGKSSCVNWAYCSCMNGAPFGGVTFSIQKVA